MKWILFFLALLVVLAMVFGGGIAAADEPAKVAGQWEMSWEGPQGTVTAALKFEQDGEKLKGTYTGPRGGEAAITGTIKGKAISFSVKRETQRGQFTIEYTGTVDGDSMKGTAHMGPRTIDWTAKRQKEK